MTLLTRSPSKVTQTFDLEDVTSVQLLDVNIVGFGTVTASVPSMEVETNPAMYQARNVEAMLTVEGVESLSIDGGRWTYWESQSPHDLMTAIKIAMASRQPTFGAPTSICGATWRVRTR